MPHTRRRFLETIAAAGSMLPLAGAERVDASRAQAPGPASSIDDIFARGVIVDDLGGFRPDPKLPNHGWDLLKTSGLTICTFGVGSVVPHESYATTIAGLARLGELVARHSDRMSLVRSYADLDGALRQKKLALIANVQNSTAFGTELKNLEVFYDLGLRQVQLTFNWRNWLGDGCTERTQAGLSYYGVDLVRKMNELGMIVDVGHTGYQTTLDAIEVSNKPIVFSHTNCKALCDHPRNKTDDQIRALAQKGGVMGLSCFNWFVSDKPRSTLDDLLNHFDHVIKLVGPDHVGIGSDFGIPGWEGKAPDEEWEEHKRIYSDWEWKLIKGRFPPYIDETNDEKRYWTIARGLSRRGHATGVIEQVLGQNFLRVFKAVLAA
jgi:membrane dipeptidase